MIWGDHILEAQTEHLFWLLLFFSFIWATVATMGPWQGRLFLMYELKAHLIISKYRKEQQQILPWNVSLRTKNLEFPPQWIAGKIWQKSQIHHLITWKKKKNWKVFLRLQRGKIRIKNILISFHWSPGLEKYHGATIFHLVAFLDHLKIINIMNTFW